MHIIVNTVWLRPADKLLKTSLSLEKEIRKSGNRLVLSLKCAALVLKPVRDHCCVKSEISCLKLPYVFIEIIITNIAFDRINFLVLCSVEPYQLNVAFFLCDPTLQVPARNKAGMETGAGNWKEGSCCVVETAVPTAISSEHASLAHSPDACVSCLIILNVLEGTILVRLVMLYYP